MQPVYNAWRRVVNIVCKRPVLRPRHPLPHPVGSITAAVGLDGQTTMSVVAVVGHPFSMSQADVRIMVSAELEARPYGDDYAH